MSKERKRLPKPPTSPFGAKRRFEEREEGAPLMADQMAKAMAEGRLEEFLKKELPDNDHARSLAMMMLGMTGMLPHGPGPSQPEEKGSGPSPDKMSPKEAPAGDPPEEVLVAAQSGDVQGLMELLEREHKRRLSDTSEGVMEVKQEDNPAPAFNTTEKETIGKLMEIASRNNLTLDWIVLRALRRYIEEYRKTGLL